MRQMLAVVLGFVYLAFIVGCGNNSSTTKTISDSFPTPVPALTSPGVMGGAKQGVGPLSFNNYSVGTLTGSVAGFSNHSTAVSPPAKFNRPIAVTTDGTFLYVADFFNNVIRRIEIKTGIDITLAGSTKGAAGFANTAPGVTALFNRPSGITTDGINLYVADSGNFLIRKIVISTGEVTSVAGTQGAPGSVDDPVGASAKFNDLNGITTDGTSLFVTDSNNTIRRIALSGTFPVTTLAGTPGKVGSTDTKDATANNPVSFNQPARLTTDGQNLYVTDFGDGTIRKIDLRDGTVSTIAGTSGPGGIAGSDKDGIGTDARFNQPSGITTDGTNLYVTDSFANTVRQIVIATKKTTTVAGPAVQPSDPAASAGSIDARNGIAARFNTPIDITTDGVSLYIVDIENHKIRRIKD